MNAFAYSVWLTDPKAIAFVCISCGLMFLIGVYYIVSYVIKRLKVKNKVVNHLFKTSYTVYIALVMAIIMGIIYSSLKHYANMYHDPKDPENFFGQLWVWQAVNFNYAIGSWIVTALFFTLLIMMPAVSYISLRKIFLEKTDYWFNAKKFLWIIFMVIVTLAVMCLFYVGPHGVSLINGKDTSLSVFGLNKIYDDQFYYSAKWVYIYIFYTLWYPVLFIGWVSANIIIFGAIAYLEVIKNYSILDNTKVVKLLFKKTGHNEVLHSFNATDLVLKGLILPYNFFDGFSSIELYAFFSAFMLFNIKSPFIHIGMISLLLIITFICLMLSMYVFGMIKFRHNMKGYTKAYFEIVHKKFFNWFLTKEQKAAPYLSDTEMMNKYNSTNYSSLKLTHTITVGIGFTIFLGFTNLTSYDTFNQIGTQHWSEIMYHPYFWFTSGVSAIIINYVFVDATHQSSMAKNAVGSAGYAVTPGMQTGTLSFLGQWLGKSGAMIDEQLKLVI